MIRHAQTVKPHPNRKYIYELCDCSLTKKPQQKKPNPKLYPRTGPHEYFSLQSIYIAIQKTKIQKKVVGDGRPIK